MRNFTIQFAYPWAPWLFLLLIPAFALTLIPYFRLNKRYRKTRNRIISMVLHLIVMVLAVCVLTGMTFHYTVPNENNEIILLVDVSETEEQSADRRDAFVETVLRESGYEGIRVGIVTFGFSQQYAVPLTNDTDSVFEQYRNAPLPDTSATDIAAALRYARGLFTDGSAGKIVLVSDGKETDESAFSVIRAVSAQGIRVDSVNIGSEFADDNVQVLDVEFPDYHVNVNQKFPLVVSVYAKNAVQGAVIRLSENGAALGDLTQDLVTGAQTVTFTDVSFSEEGLHELEISVTDPTDGLSENNIYHSYHYLEVFNRVLVIDQGVTPGESDELEKVLTSGTDIKYEVTQLHLKDLNEDTIPSTLADLRAYDQIVLNNVSNDDLKAENLPDPGNLSADMKEQDRANWFVNLLYRYVSECGGGLFTTGGTNGEKNAQGQEVSHAYNRQDLYNTRLQEMLPVEAINYTPPVGVIVIIDVSGSMEGQKLEWAKNGAISCLDALTYRDYIGVMTLSAQYTMNLQLTSRTEETAIKEAIQNLKGGGDTKFSVAIDRAGRALIAEDRVDRRHIVIVTDGEPTEEEDNYMDYVRRYHRENQITFSVVGIEVGDPGRAKKIVEEGGGTYHPAANERDILSEMREDLNAKVLEEFDPTPFKPYVNNVLSPVVDGVPYGEGDSVNSRMIDVQLDGFFGVKARESADTVLVGDFGVPVYAQWNFGEGKVGSFMCDVSGKLSAGFLASDTGQRILRNIVANLMPTTDISPSDIRLDLREDNYINQLSVYTALGAGETLEGTITEYTAAGETVHSLTALSEAEGDCYVTAALSADNNFSRCTFVIKQGGTYRIDIVKKDAAGNQIDAAQIFKSFSYSQEYDIGIEEEEQDRGAFLAELSSRGKGKTVSEEEPWEVLSDFVTELPRETDPRIAFMITAMVLFLLDIAVRKFKFKWPHELIREYKERKASQR